MKLEVGKSYRTHGSNTLPSFIVRIVGIDENGVFLAVDAEAPYRSFKYLVDGTPNNYGIFVDFGFESIAESAKLVMEVSDENA